MRTPKDNRRYKLHQRIKKQGARYSAQKKTIYVPDGSTLSKWEIELREKFHYSIQTEIA